MILRGMVDFNATGKTHLMKHRSLIILDAAFGTGCTGSLFEWDTLYEKFYIGKTNQLQ
jgi:hypothetical protein